MIIRKILLIIFSSLYGYSDPYLSGNPPFGYNQDKYASIRRLRSSGRQQFCHPIYNHGERILSSHTTFTQAQVHAEDRDSSSGQLAILSGQSLNNAIRPLQRVSSGSDSSSSADTVVLAPKLDASTTEPQVFPNSITYGL